MVGLMVTHITKRAGNMMTKLSRDSAVDCTDSNAGMVLSYYRKGIPVFLPLAKFGAFLKYIRTMNLKAGWIDEWTCERHTACPVDNGVIIRMNE